MRKRPTSSAALYKKVWTDKGSPLLFHSLNLEAQLQKYLGDDFAVALGMRYGQPSIENALRFLSGEKIDEIRVVPLYPQYSLAATESSIDKVKTKASELGIKAPLKFIGPFYDDPTFINAFKNVAEPVIKNKRPDHIIFSFHGLPERQVKKTDKGAHHCLKDPNCCASIKEVNKNCYRAQCFATAHKIAEALHLEPSRYTVSFQSRLGRTPWIKPYTDFLYAEFPKTGKKNIVVISPSFVADCLETLEEIALRGKEQFLSQGGEDLTLVPSLNSGAAWVESLAVLIKKN